MVLIDINIVKVIGTDDPLRKRKIITENGVVVEKNIHTIGQNTAP